MPAWPKAQLPVLAGAFYFQNKAPARTGSCFHFFRAPPRASEFTAHSMLQLLPGRGRQILPARRGTGTRKPKYVCATEAWRCRLDLHAGRARRRRFGRWMQACAVELCGGAAAPEKAHGGEPSPNSTGLCASLRQRSMLRWSEASASRAMPTRGASPSPLLTAAPRAPSPRAQSGPAQPGHRASKRCLPTLERFSGASAHRLQSPETACCPVRSSACVRDSVCVCVFW